MPFLSITEMVQAIQAETSVPPDQIARLAVNSPEFYCAVGSVPDSSTIPTPLPHVIAAQAQETQRDFPSLRYVNVPQHEAALQGAR